MSDTPMNAEARVERYRLVSSLLAQGAASQAVRRLDRYARALLRRAESAREIVARGQRRIDRLADLNEAGLLDYRGLRDGALAFALSPVGRALMTAPALRRPA